MSVAMVVAVLANATLASGSPPDRSVVSYYDRNRDGITDYELHQVPGTTYWTWALIDSKFRGRYDVRMKLAYPFGSERVNLPVPRNVKVIPGMPPYRADQRFNPPKPAP